MAKYLAIAKTFLTEFEGVKIEQLGGLKFTCIHIDRLDISFWRINRLGHCNRFDLGSQIWKISGICPSQHWVGAEMDELNYKLFTTWQVAKKKERSTRTLNKRQHNFGSPLRGTCTEDHIWGPTYCASTRALSKTCFLKSMKLFVYYTPGEDHWLTELWLRDTDGHSCRKTPRCMSASVRNSNSFSP